MIAIVDYGVGNLFSLKRSFAAIGERAEVTSDKKTIETADKIILPGVGAFSDAAKKLDNSGIGALLTDLVSKNKIVLGICLGMQLLFDKSYEYGETKGLSLIGGSVKPLSGVVSNDLKIPHMGWNALKFNKPHPLFKYIREGDFVYFVHSFFATDCEKNVIATAEYGADITAAVANKNVLGCQFHPEKSGKVGLDILKAFCELKETDLC